MIDDVAGLADQLRWAGRLEALAPITAARVVLCGLGGSAMAGDVASLVAEGAGNPAPVHRDYGLPGWVGRGDLVVAFSYSGNTEEVLSAVAEGERRGATLSVITSGGELGERAAGAGWPSVLVPAGLQPRAALGFLSGAGLTVLRAAGFVGPIDAALREAAAAIDEVVGESGPSTAAEIVAAIEDHIVVVYGSAGVGSTAARRWKTQLNENAKWPAFWGELPEMNHNEIVGWAGGASRCRAAVVWLHDSADLPRLRLRASLTKDLIGGDVVLAGDVYGKGGDRLARVFSLIAVGDLTSLVLADRKGTDPVPVLRIEELKRLLRGD